MKLTSIIKELNELNIPYSTARDDEVIWCPPYSSRRDYPMIMFTSNDGKDGFCSQGFYCSKSDDFQSYCDYNVFNHHKILSNIVNFYYTYIEE